MDDITLQKKGENSLWVQIPKKRKDTHTSSTGRDITLTPQPPIHYTPDRNKFRSFSKQKTKNLTPDSALSSPKTSSRLDISSASESSRGVSHSAFRGVAATGVRLAPLSLALADDDEANPPPLVKTAPA